MKRTCTSKTNPLMAPVAQTTFASERDVVVTVSGTLTVPLLVSFGALDPFTRDELNAELQRTWLATRKTVVFITHSITEAVYLGGRVVMMARGPGRIADVIPIELERPRGLEIRETAEFAAYVARIRDTFRDIGIFKG